MRSHPLTARTGELTNNRLFQIEFILFIIALTSVISWRLSQVGKEMMKSLQVGVGLFLAGAISSDNNFSQEINLKQQFFPPGEL